MDAKDLLRRYLEQRRELGESELVLDGLHVEDVMRLLGAAGKSATATQPRKSIRELVPDAAQDWRASLRDAGVNVDAPTLVSSVPVPAPIASSPPTDETPDDMAFKKGIVVGTSEAELIPSAIDKLRSLEEIAEKVHKCTRCGLYKTATHGVPGEGDPKAELVCVGEAPGAKEDETGRPFVGQAGQLLTKILAAIDLTREQVFICNVLKHRPPGNRNPLPDEVEACSPYLVRQLELIKPKVIVAFGTFAAQMLLQTKTPLGQLRGLVHRYHGIPLIVTYHPAALLRNPAWKRPTWQDVKLAVEFSIAAPVRDPYKDRRPPYSEDAEQAVLSAMLMDPDAILRATEFLDDSMFYREGHRRIYRAMLALAERGDVVDPLTLSEELARSGSLEPSGGKDYVGFLVDAVPTAANVEYHAKIVREKALRRRLIEVSTAIVSEAFESAAPATELLDEAEHKIFEVNQSRGSEGFMRIKELLWPTMERIEEIQRGSGSITGVASGFKDLDELTAGFQPSDLIIVAGRPSMGKTAFVLNIAQNAALDHNVPVAFFSLEMSKEQLVQRLLTSEGRVDAQRLRKGKLHDEEFVRLGRAAGILSHAPIWIDDTPSMTLLEMRSKARRLKMEHNIGMVVIDYLQLMQGPTNTESRQQEISYISRSLKALSRELRVPVVALSQLSRAPEQRTGENKRPQLSDLRESGAIEQDADLVMFIYRQEVYDGPTDKDGNSLEGRAEIIVGKQRNGPTGFVNLYFNKTYTRFENLSPRLATQ